MRKKLALISAVFLITLAGCADPESTISMDEMDNETEVANSTTLERNELAEPLKKTIINGESNRTDYNYLDSDRYIRDNGSVYAIQGEIVGQESKVRFDYNLSETKNKSEIDFNNLTEEDQDTISSGIRKIKERDDNKRDIRFGNSYSLDAQNESVLLENNITIINYQNKSYEFEINDRNIVKEEIYKYNRELISNSLESYGQNVIDKYAFNISFSDQKQRDFVNKSINDNYYGKQNETVESIIKQFDRERAYRLEESRGVWFVRYNNQLYKTELSWRGNIIR